GAAYHRQAQRSRSDDFGIVGANGGRNHHHRRVLHMRGFMADENFDAAAFEALRVIAFLRVGALHFVAEIVQYLGDAAHADAADADEMNSADIKRKLMCQWQGIDGVHAAASLRTSQVGRGCDTASGSSCESSPSMADKTSEASFSAAS